MYMKLLTQVCLLFLTVLLFSCTKEKLVHHLPVVKITANDADLFSDSTGIYVVGIGTGVNWQGERANYFEGRTIPIDFEFQENGISKIRQSVGLKVSGGGSRKLPQKSFNIYAKSKYGQNRLHYSFFKDLPYSKYKALRLRVSGQDWKKTHFRDALMHEIVRDLDIDLQAYQPVVVYLNNQYWGIYNLREKFNLSYLRQHR